MKPGRAENLSFPKIPSRPKSDNTEFEQGLSARRAYEMKCPKATSCCFMISRVAIVCHLLLSTSIFVKALLCLNVVIVEWDFPDRRRGDYAHTSRCQRLKYALDDSGIGRPPQ
jgi:hypothetical protein